MVPNPLLLPLPGLIPLIAVLACLWVLVRGLRVPRGIPTRAACGRCRYEITFTSPVCPECGSDLRAVGTLTARTALSQRTNLFALLLAWLVLVVVGFGFGWRMCERVAADRTVTRIQFDQSFTPRRATRVSQGKVLPRYRVRIRGDVAGGDWADLAVQIVPEVGPRVLIAIDAAGRQWTLRSDGAPMTGSGLDPVTVTRFYEAARIGVSTDFVQQEIVDLASVIDLILQVGPDAARQQGWGVTPQRATRVEPPRPDLTTLRRRGRGRKTGGGVTEMTLTYVDTPEFGSGVEVRVAIEYTEGVSDRPESLRSLEVSMPTEGGWPVRIECDLESREWTAVRGEEEWQTGALPVSESAIDTVLQRYSSETGYHVLEGTSGDVETLMDLALTDLVTLTGWTPPEPASEAATPRLEASGGSYSTGGRITPSVFSLWQTRTLIATSGLIWLAGGWWIIRRRRRLLRSPLE